MWAPWSLHLGVTQCTCEQGYVGRFCEYCAYEYQDNDGNKTCEPTCQALDLNCGQYGSCMDTSGKAKCYCVENYTGKNCEKCAKGYQDNDDNGSCLQSCELADLDCGQHGTCSDSSGIARCACTDGYAGVLCEQCAAGYHQEAGDCIADENCQANTCSNHGDCDDNSGIVICICDQGFAGDRCEDCKSGFQDNDSDGYCLLDCSTANLNCGTHGSCSDITGESLCVCQEGYVGDTC